ncbi:MAG TPA: cob(I)yrinic acid a,c-diamide adenosyltransferase [Vicinamibacteria bacterium]|nr:cob(I)yrinic acid a,c-diamide adenosyltransferase [Vicinamibacteria bacterium]
MKIYTRGGDRGDTGLVDGSRVRKDHVRVAAYGDLDELNSILGLALAETRRRELAAVLHEVQRDLFALGAQLADPSRRVAGRKAKAAVAEAHVERLEREIDRCEARLEPLRAFVLPGGSRVGALLHLARTVCRRAERTVVTLSQREGVDPRVMVYVNRLSDLLFVLARLENRRARRRETRW